MDANAPMRTPTAKASWIDLRLVLIVFVRALSIVFLASGLQSWAILLGPLAPGGDYLTLPLDQAVAVGFFAVVDPVAAVGLWLLSSWGTVVWLIAALTESVLHSVFRDSFGFDPWVIGFHAVTIVVYAGLMWRWERARDG